MTTAHAPCRNRTYNLPEQSSAPERESDCGRAPLPIERGAKRSRTPAEIATKSQQDSAKRVPRGTRSEILKAAWAEKKRVARLVAASPSAVAEADGGTVSLFVMVANNSGAEARRLAATYPGRIGHLYGPGGWRGPFPEFPYALDNGAFPAFTKGTAWDEAAFLALCERAAGAAVAPRWVAVPDVVCDRAGTLAAWGRWSSILRERFGWPLAFVVQDGMTHEDVPDDAALLFVGGSTTWKQQTAAYWRERMPRVHIGA
jgi:hypothetical protein